MSSKRKTPGGKCNVNQDISDMLLELAEFEKNQRALHKYNAYRKAAASVGKHPEKISSGDEAKALPGVGPKIALKIDELLATGKLNKLEKIRKDDTSVAVKDLTRVSGIGPVLAHQLLKDGIASVEELRKAEAEKPRLSQAQSIGLRYLEDMEQRIPREEMELLEAHVQAVLRKLDPKYKAIVCGSFRRGNPTSGDIDFLIAHPDYAAKGPKGAKHLKAIVHALGDFVVETIASGTAKFMGLCRLEGKKVHRRLDLSLLPFPELWLGVLYFTGSDEFNRQMRAEAQEKGFTLNEHSLRPVGKDGQPGQPLPVHSEKDVFDKLAMDWKEPNQRNF